MASTTSTSSYLDPPQLHGVLNKDGTYTLSPLELKKQSDFNYYVAKMIQGGLNLANLTKEVNLELSDAAGNITELQITAEGLTSTVSDLSGDVAEVQQTATGLTSTVSSLSGQVSSVQQTAAGLTTTVNNLGGDVSSLDYQVSVVKQTVDGLSIENQTGSYTIINGDKLKSVNSATTSQVVIENGQVELATQGDMVTGRFYFDYVNSRIVLESDWGMPLKIVSANNMSIDVPNSSTIYIGTSSTSEHVNIGSSTATVNLIGTINNNGVALGAAVFT